MREVDAEECRGDFSSFFEGVSIEGDEQCLNLFRGVGRGALRGYGSGDSGFRHLYYGERMVTGGQS